jgi:FkbM family methyltransferase
VKQTLGIWLPDSDKHFAVQIAGNPLVAGKGTYQWKKYVAALAHVKHRGHAVDVGAHVGLWSRLMAMDFERVTAFEPVDEHCKCFRANVPAENVTLMPCAVGAEMGQTGVVVDAGNSGNAHLGTGTNVLMVTMDAPRMKTVDFLKIDVEGWERDVLLGGEQTIREDKPVIAIEQKPGNAERYGIGQTDAVELLKSWGMKEASRIGDDYVMAW